MELKWPIPIEDFQIIVYESAILSTKYLQECIKDFMTCLLTTLREMFKISPEEHENIMTYLCVRKLQLNQDGFNNKDQYLC